MAWGAVTAFLAGPSRTLLQRNAPPGAQGRVLALDQTVEGLGHLVAMPVAAGLAAAFGVQGAAVAIGLVVTVGGSWGLWRVATVGRVRDSSAWAPPLTKPQSSI
jgi:hypothetical protein